MNWETLVLIYVTIGGMMVMIWFQGLLLSNGLNWEAVRERPIWALFAWVVVVVAITVFWFPILLIWAIEEYF